ncbi:MAG: response regulator [Holophagaceae bacterium]
MARLLLVDDNPSIHKIAETLLGASYVELVCVESAEAALGLLSAGETFDIALLDTTMPGMDGWELLSRLRANPATAHIPVAMMAGVLDTVDPERLASAPIQGFLKKPIELRDLPDRVRQLLGTPVQAVPPPPPAAMPEFVPTQGNLPEPNPYATQPPGTPLPSLHVPAGVDPADLETLPPGTKLSDLQGLGGMESGDLVTLPPGTKLSDLHGLSPSATTPGLQLDLLLLTPEDLLAEEVPVPEPELDLEELDLESLRGLPLEAPAAVEASAIAPEPFDLTPSAGLPAAVDAGPTWEELPSVEPSLPTAPDFPLELPAVEPAPNSFQVVSGEVLGVPAEPEPAWEPAPVPAVPVPAAASVELPPIQTMDLDADAFPAVETSMEEWSAPAEPLPGSHPMAAALATGALAAGGLAAAGSLAAPLAAAPAPAPSLPPLEPGPATDLLRALMSDPAAMDALARAVVAHLGDQALREIAWEVMPELAEKLHRPS